MLLSNQLSWGMVIMVVESWLMCVASFAHLMILGGDWGILCRHIHAPSIEWRRPCLGNRSLYLLHGESGIMRIA